MHTYHILNGDALHEQFPTTLKEEKIIIFREMLMDGPLSEVLDISFYNKRSDYIDALAGEDAQYIELVRPQIDQIKNLPDDSTAYLWFEQDLFCQVNFWSCVTWMSKYCEDLKMYLVEPPSRDWRGFGGMSEEALSQAFSDARLLGPADVEVYKEAFKLYVGKEAAVMHDYTNQDGLDPTVKEALEAELTRLPDADGQVALHQIVKDLHKEEQGDFSKIFKRFSKTYGIYGMGDFQFKILLEKLTS